MRRRSRLRYTVSTVALVLVGSAGLSAFYGGDEPAAVAMPRPAATAEPWPTPWEKPQPPISEGPRNPSRSRAVVEARQAIAEYAKHSPFFTGVVVTDDGSLTVALTAAAPATLRTAIKRLAQGQVLRFRTTRYSMEQLDRKISQVGHAKADLAREGVQLRSWGTDELNGVVSIGVSQITDRVRVYFSDLLGPDAFALELVGKAEYAS